VFDRWLAQEIQGNRANRYVLILFGARQTGKPGEPAGAPRSTSSSSNGAAIPQSR
jgi:hypothetical protein